jgi:hypothetical protein
MRKAPSAPALLTAARLAYLDLARSKGACGFARGQAHCHSTIDGHVPPCCLFAEPRARAWRSYVAEPVTDRPNLEQLKKQAKSLLHAAHAEDRAALDRFAVLPAFANKPAAAIGALGPALHDAQSVIAREHGFASWNALREEVESRTLSFDAAIDEFVRCATGDASGRAERLLALHPGIASASLHTALVLGDDAGVEGRLRDHPGLATQPGGPQNWEPLLYVCHTCMHNREPGRLERLVAIARRLCALGANPNAEYHWNWHPELPRTALWGALCAVRHLPLAEVLLDAGANPTDGVTVHLAASGGNLAALDLSPASAQRDGFRGVPPLVHDVLGDRPGWTTVAARTRRGSQSRLGP